MELTTMEKELLEAINKTNRRCWHTWKGFWILDSNLEKYDAYELDEAAFHLSEMGLIQRQLDDVGNGYWVFKKNKVSWIKKILNKILDKQ